MFWSKKNPRNNWSDIQRTHVTHVGLFDSGPCTMLAYIWETHFFRLIHMCQQCCRRVLWQLRSLHWEALWQRLIQSVRLMWGRQDSCLVSHRCRVRVRRENRASVKNLKKNPPVGDLMCLCNTWKTWVC